MTTLTQTQSPAAVRSNILTLAFAAAVGLLLIGSAGFAQASVAHDAAHDARHAVAFPCH